MKIIVEKNKEDEGYSVRVENGNRTMILKKYAGSSLNGLKHATIFAKKLTDVMGITLTIIT